MTGVHIELIPKTCWGKNLRTQIKKSEWDRIRKSVYEKQNMVCYTCGEESEVLEAHERWEYDEKRHVQKLVDIIGVCKPCHGVIHFGRSQMVGYDEQATAQYMKVNYCEMIELRNEQLEVLAEWHSRNKITDWALDLTFIEKQGIVVER